MKPTSDQSVIDALAPYTNADMLAEIARRDTAESERLRDIRWAGEQARRTANRLISAEHNMAAAVMNLERRRESARQYRAENRGRANPETVMKDEKRVEVAEEAVELARRELEAAQAEAAK